MPPCQIFPMGQKYYQQNTHHFNKTAACSHHCSLSHEHRHWGIDIMGYTFRSTIQTQAIPPPSRGSAPTPGDYRQSIESPMGVPTFNSTEKVLKFTSYDYEIVIKGMIFDDIYPFGCGVYSSSNICQMRWAINRPTAVKGFML